MSPHQAHGGNSKPAPVKTASDFKTNIPLNTGHLTPQQGSKLKVKTFPTVAGLFVRSGN